MRKTAGIFSIVIAAVILFAGWRVLEFSTYTVAPASKLWVEGTSTIHDYTCQVGEFGGVFNANTGAADAIAGLERVEVTVPVKEIDCGNGTMDKKMREALQANSHPEIRYEMTETKVVPGTGAGSYRLTAKGNLTMAGKALPIEIGVDGTQLDNGDMRFEGSTVVRMSDFDIDRPSAAFGTIKTGDEVTVRFEVTAAAAGQ